MRGSVATMDVGDVFAEHGAWLRRWLHGRTRCPHRAADLAQDTFCRLIERPDALPIRDARNLLTVIARRLLIDDIRRRDVERAFLAAHAELHEPADPLTPERIAQAVQLLEGLALLLSGMPAIVREAFLLRRIEGLAHADIADRLGISDRSVKRHIARAYALCYAHAYPDEERAV